jgi:hypothetical protein
LSVHSIPTHHDNPYGNLHKGRLGLVAQVLNVLLWTKNAKSQRGSIFRSVYWDEWQNDSKEEKQYDIIPVYPFHIQRLSIEHLALIIERVPLIDVTATRNNNIRTCRSIGLLYDVINREASAPSLGEESTRYNYGQPEQQMATLVLI